MCLLDDPLSAVDAHVGKELFFNCIVKSMTNRGKGVILATHQLQYLSYADKILVLGDDGCQQFFGTYVELQAVSHEMPQLGLTIPSPGSPSTPALENNSSLLELVEVQSTKKKYNPLYNTAHVVDNEKKRLIIQLEEKAVGSIDSAVYYKYMKSGGIVEGILALVVAFTSQALLMITDYWLRWWASTEFWNSQHNPHYLWVYALLVISVIILKRFCVYYLSYLYSAYLWDSTVPCHGLDLP